VERLFLLGRIGEMQLFQAAMESHQNIASIAQWLTWDRDGFLGNIDGVTVWQSPPLCGCRELSTDG
jgi:hypothetical protein